MFTLQILCSLNVKKHGAILQLVPSISHVKLCQGPLMFQLCGPKFEMRVNQQARHFLYKLGEERGKSHKCLFYNLQGCLTGIGYTTQMPANMKYSFFGLVLFMHLLRTPTFLCINCVSDAKVMWNHKNSLQLSNLLRYAGGTKLAICRCTHRLNN